MVDFKRIYAGTIKALSRLHDDLKTHLNPRSVQQSSRDLLERVAASSPSLSSFRQPHMPIYPPVQKISQGWLGYRAGVSAWRFPFYREAPWEGWLRRLERYLGCLCAEDGPIARLRLLSAEVF